MTAWMLLALAAGGIYGWLMAGHPMPWRRRLAWGAAVVLAIICIAWSE